MRGESFYIQTVSKLNLTFKIKQVETNNPTKELTTAAYISSGAVRAQCLFTATFSSFPFKFHVS